MADSSRSSDIGKPDNSETVSPDTSKKSNEFIKVRVLGNDSHEMHFRIKHTTSIGKLKRSYSERSGMPLENLRFLFDGKRLSDNETPKTLEMENDDVIEVYQEQAGGSSNKL